MNWFNLSDNVNMFVTIGVIVIIAVLLSVVGTAFKRMKEKKSEAELSEHEWDGIGEYKNPLPKPWAIMFVVLILFAIWYWLFGFPLNKYSSIGEYNEEVAAYNAKYKANYAKLSDEEKVIMGKRLFFVYCSQCHGIEGTGINGKAQDLTKWSSVDGILDVLENGSTGLGFGEMPAGLVADDDAKNVAEFVASGFSKNDAGKEVFANSCADCHGENGEGIEGVAPAIGLYKKPEFVEMVLQNGKKADEETSVKVIGVMPSFANMLSSEQMNALARYVNTLSEE